MTPKRLREIGIQLYGKWGWQTKLAAALEVDGSTVRRWVSGAVPISRVVELAVQKLADEPSPHLIDGDSWRADGRDL